MSQECLMSGCQRKFSMENCKKESAHKVAKRNATTTPLKPRLRISIESWEQAAQDRTKWRCLINKGASQFEEKRICEAERKRKERKARAKNYHQSQHSPNSHALFATDSLELKLAYTAINEHTNTHKRLILRN